MEKKMEEYSNLAFLLVLITVIFVGVEAFVWVGLVDLPALGNLNNKLDQLFENPAFVGLVTTLFVGVFSGFMENWSNTGETFELSKFAETFYYYEPLLILISQWLPMKHAVAFTFGLDVLRRLFKKFRGEREPEGEEREIPPYPPPLPTSVLFKDVLGNIRVYVDDGAYPVSPGDDGCKVGYFKVMRDETKEWKTMVVIAFLDYNPHEVQIIAGDKTVFDDVLQYGQMVKT